jgi:serine/threonine protein kinase/Tfp pilus assembly protein PilF
LSLPAGTRLGPYEILAPIGAGGMGEVYRAKDTRLGRDVAIKVLPQHLASSPDLRQRFEREARAIATLSHPNVLAIYDFGDHGGTAYVVMELLDGRTLRDRLDAGALSRENAIDYAFQIAKGLSAAHEKGVVHRDLKPENIFVTKDGNVKILDFGLAKMTERVTARDETSSPTEQRTEPGTVMGTVGYMAPEQVRGIRVDQRSDIFSFGTVLYEMLTGQRAFQRETSADTMAAILNDNPPAPSAIRAPLPAELDRIVLHCLEKEREERFQSAGDLAFALKAFSSGAHATIEGGTDRRRSPSVAVLPFLNLSADPENEYFADGIMEDVIANLSKIRSLKVISRTSVMAFKKREKSLREIGTALGAKAILEGSVRRAGNRVRIVAQLIDSETDEYLWADTYDRDLTDIFAIQTEVALQIAAALRAELSPDERERIQRVPTHDLHAHQLYLQGRYWFCKFTEEGFNQAIAYFEKAISEDPRFALAHAGLALVYTELGIGQGSGALQSAVAFGKAKDAAARALALDDQLGDAHSVAALLKFVCDYDWTGAEKEFQLALELSPGSADIYGHYGWLCSALERYEDAIRLMKRAQELDPLAHPSDLATTLLRAGRYREALELAQRLIEFEPGLSRGYSISGWARIKMGSFAEGLAALERAVSLAPGSPMFQAQLGQAYALAGRVNEARDVLQKLNDLARQQYIPPYFFAYVHAGLGDEDAAMDCLDRAYEQRSGALYGIKGSFLFENLRSHPRFKALLRKMNLA